MSLVPEVKKWCSMKGGELLEILLVLFFLFIIIAYIIFTVLGAIYIGRTAEENGQGGNKVAWLLGFILGDLFMGFGPFILGAYLIVTGRKGWGIFWIVAPVVLGVFLFFVFLFIGVVASTVI